MENQDPASGTKDNTKEETLYTRIKTPEQDEDCVPRWGKVPAQRIAEHEALLREVRDELNH